MSDPRTSLQKAEKILASANGGFSFFGGREDKYQNAAELFQQAGNTFRVQNQNLEAGKALEAAANVHERYLKDADEAANCRLEAFKAYRKDEPLSAVRCLELAIKQYCSRGNFRRAASHQEKLGELYEEEVKDKVKAVEAYELAAGWYDNDGASAMANKLWLKVAEMAALNDDFYKAIDIFERIARSSVDNNLMRYSVKEYFFKAGICHLATADLVATERALGQFVEIDPTFQVQRELKLLQDLLKHMSEGDVDEFTKSLWMFDQVSKLDKWKTAMLVKVKNTIVEKPATMDGDDDEFA